MAETLHFLRNLENAASAAELELTIKTGSCKGGPFIGLFVNGISWNPLNDDGDSRRLAVKLGISLEIEVASVTATAYIFGRTCRWTIADTGDKCADARLATLVVASQVYLAIKENNLEP